MIAAAALLGAVLALRTAYVAGVDRGRAEERARQRARWRHG